MSTFSGVQCLRLLQGTSGLEKVRWRRTPNLHVPGVLVGIYVLQLHQILTTELSHRDGAPKTSEEMRQSGLKVRPGQVRKNTDVIRKHHGVKGRSLLHTYSVNKIDIVNDVTTEYMHSMCLGFNKRKAHYLVGVEKKDKSGYDGFITGIFSARCPQMEPEGDYHKCLISVHEVDKVLESYRVPSEFSRATRSLTDLIHFKAEEFRNLFIFYFDAIILDLDQTMQPLLDLTLHVVWFERCLLLPDDEYHHRSHSRHLIKKNQKRLYELYTVNSALWCHTCVILVFLAGGHGRGPLQLLCPPYPCPRRPNEGQRRVDQILSIRLRGSVRPGQGCIHCRNRFSRHPVI